MKVVKVEKEKMTWMEVTVQQRVMVRCLSRCEYSSIDYSKSYPHTCQSSDSDSDYGIGSGSGIDSYNGSGSDFDPNSDE